MSQLYEPTSGSCVYYGKSIQELNPEYIQKNINNLKKQQEKAGEYYQKSLGTDAKIKELKEKAQGYDAEGNARDAKAYDKLQKEIARLEFESKELKKEASRQLREGSRTVGSLILCKDLDAVVDLFTKAEDEVKQGADQYADQVKTDSLQYADDMLGYLGNSLQSALRAIEDNRNSVNEERKGLAELIASRVQHATAQPEAIPAPVAAEEAEEAPAEED